MSQDDGAASLEDILDARDARDVYLRRKTVLRLMLNSDQDLKIMPVYFERLKMYTKVR